MLRSNRVLCSRDVELREGSFAHLRAYTEDPANPTSALAAYAPDADESGATTRLHESSSDEAETQGGPDAGASRPKPTAFTSRAEVLSESDATSEEEAVEDADDESEYEVEEVTNHRGSGDEL